MNKTGKPNAVALRHGCYLEPTIVSVTPQMERVEAGQVAVDLPTSRWDVHHPFGGFRDSGSAFKEQEAPGLRFFTRVETAAVRFAW